MKCYYDNDLCQGSIWTCRTCGKSFCEIHNHVTSLGENVECSACERARLDKLEAKAKPINLGNIDAQIDRLDIKDK